MDATAEAQVVISLDVSDLRASLEFYRLVLGFEVLASEREGMIFEARTLVSGRVPAIRLRLRAAFGRRPTGSSGGMLSLAVRTPDLAARIAELSGKVRWVGEVPAAPTPGQHVRIADPDGYIVELFN